MTGRAVPHRFPYWSRARSSDVASSLAEIRRLRLDVEAVARAVGALRQDLEEKRESASADRPEPTETAR